MIRTEMFGIKMDQYEDDPSKSTQSSDGPTAGTGTLVFASVATLYTFYIGLPIEGAMISSVCWLAGAGIRMVEVGWSR